MLACLRLLVVCGMRMRPQTNAKERSVSSSSGEAQNGARGGGGVDKRRGRPFCCCSSFYGNGFSSLEHSMNKSNLYKGPVRIATNPHHTKHSTLPHTNLRRNSRQRDATQMSRRFVDTCQPASQQQQQRAVASLHDNDAAAAAGDDLFFGRVGVCVFVCGLNAKINIGTSSQRKRR